jgi:hypothetical protein
MNYNIPLVAKYKYWKTQEWNDKKAINTLMKEG